MFPDARSLALLLACACLTDLPVDFRVVGDDAGLEEATELVLALERDQRTILQQHFAPDLSALDLGGLPYLEGGQLRLDVRVGAFVIARGRSLPFVVDASGLNGSADIFVGRLGRFSSPLSLPLDADVEALAATDRGAVVVTRSGTYYDYVHHRREDGRAELVRVGTLPTVGASVSAVGAALLAIGGPDDVVRWIDLTELERGNDGQVASLSSAHRYGASVVPLATGALVVGGSAREFGAPSSALTFVTKDAGELRIEPRDDLPCAHRDSASTEVQVDGGRFERVIVVCGGGVTESRLLSIDPRNGRTQALVLVGGLEEASFAPIAPGIVLVSGGRDADGNVSARTHVLAVGAERFEVLEPGPPSLFHPRRQHAVLPVRTGLALVVGGRDDGGGLSASELVAFPGDVVLTGPIPFEATNPRLVLLRDGSVLAASREGLAAYIVPRD